MSDAPLTIDALSYSYPHDWSRKKIRVLHDLNLSVASGEAHAFLGVNGAGKTTTIKAILGLITPETGRVSIFGRDSRSSEARSALGYIPEQPYFYDHLTVRELLTMFGKLRGASEKEVFGVAERLDLASRNDHHMRQLSKGLVQRVALAQAILHRPRLLILDEPFSGLDPVARHLFREIFAQLKRDGTSILISSHVLGDVSLLCDSVTLLKRGRIVRRARISDIGLSTDETFEVHVARMWLPPDVGSHSLRIDDHALVHKITCRDAHAANAVVRAVQAAGGTVQSMAPVSDSLERLFMETMREGGATT